MAGRECAAKKKEPRWFLYILKCKDNTFYTGITTDLDRRLDQHNNGTASRCTRSRLPVMRVYQETCADRSEALKREYAVKQLSREEKDLLVKRRQKKGRPKLVLAQDHNLPRRRRGAEKCILK